MKKISIPLIALAVIILIATFFRIYQLNQIPPGLYPDVAINGINALDTLKNHDFKVFYPDNNGREGLIIWIEALFFWLFGPSVWALKIIASLFGIATVLGLYLLSKQLLEKNKGVEVISLLSAFFLAISFWHVNFSRIGFRAIMVPFFITYGFYFLLKGLKNKKIWPTILSGVFFGLGFYTYISYRFVVLLGAITLFLWWLSIKKKKSEIKSLRLNIILLLIATFCVALPIGIYFVMHPADFFGRASDVSFLKQVNPAYELAKSVVLHLAMFNVWGDSNWRHNYPGSPELIWPVGIFFLIGFILLVKDKIVFWKKRDFKAFFVPCFLLSWFFVMLLPCFLSGEGVPHALRAIGVIPAVFIMAGIGAYWSYIKIRQFFKTKPQIIAFYICVAVFLCALTYSEFYKYFYLWGRDNDTAGAFTTDYFKIGEYINSLPDNFKKYVIVNHNGTEVNGIPMPAMTPIFIERMFNNNTRATYLKPEDIDKIEGKGNVSIVLMGYDADLITKLLIKFPEGGYEKNLKDMNGFWVYEFNKPVDPNEKPGCGCKTN